jgi:hypothetical protein
MRKIAPPGFEGCSVHRFRTDDIRVPHFAITTIETHSTRNTRSTRNSQITNASVPDEEVTADSGHMAA